MVADQKNIIDFQGARNNAGSQHLLERMFGQHKVSLRNFIRRRMGGGNEVEDVVQEVFARIAKVPDLTEKIYGDGRNYLFTIANNCIVDMERRRVLKEKFEREQSVRADEAYMDKGPEAIVDARRELEALKKVIMELKPNWRQAFILNRFHHMTYPQVADHMGISVKQVENCIVQSLSRLRDAELKLQGGHKGTSGGAK